MHSSKLLLSLCALPCTLAAQTNTPVTITNGTATFTQAGLPTSNTATTIGDALDGGGGDVLYEHWWFFRVAGDPQEYQFKDDGTATRVVNGGGTGMVTAWTDVDNRGVFSASLSQDVFASGTQGAWVLETFAITNLTGAQLDIDLFSYADYDVNGFSNDSALGGLSSMVVTDSASTTLSAELRALGNSGVEVAAFANIRAKLTNATVDNLAGWPGTFGPADFTGAFQWTLQIPPLGTGTVVSQLASLDCKPTTANYGTGGAGTPGVPTMSSDHGVLRNAPSATNIYLGNGNPTSLAVLQLNIFQTNQTLFGINVLVDQNGVSNIVTFTDAAGDASFALNLPGDPSFCGQDIFGQWIVADTGAANGFASWSEGRQLTLGAW